MRCARIKSNAVKTWTVFSLILTADESWLDMNGTKEQEIYYMLHGALVGEGYDGGTIIVDSEERTELSENEIAKINEAIQK